MRTLIAVLLLLGMRVCDAQAPPQFVPSLVSPPGAPPVGAARSLAVAAYSDTDVSTAWRALAAGYVRKALREETLDRDATLNARVDGVMAAIGAAAAAIDARFASASWRAILIEGFGYGAASFPGEVILMDSTFVRRLELGDDELALILSHEVAHVLAGHAATKLAFVARTLGRDKVPTAQAALHEFLSHDTCAAAYRPTARLQEREADSLGAAIFFTAGFDIRRALRVFDKLEALETRADGGETDSHDTPAARKESVMSVIAQLQQIHDGGGARGHVASKH